MRDFYHQAQIRSDHQGSRFAIALLDLRGQFDLLVRSQQWDLPNLAQVNLNSGIAIFSSHITLFHQILGGFGSTEYRKLYSLMLCRSPVVASGEVFNKVKYSNDCDNPGTYGVQSFLHPFRRPPSSVGKHDDNKTTGL